jgi:hypothetical protein
MSDGKPIPESGHAPADQRPQPRRPRAVIIIAYIVLSILALASIRYIDRAAVDPPPPRDTASGR